MGHPITSTTFCWTKKVTVPAHIQGLSTRSPPFYGRIYKVKLQRGVETGKGEIEATNAPPSTALHTWLTWCISPSSASTEERSAWVSE